MPVTIGGSLSFCGRELQPQELDLIRQITRDFSTLSLTELAHTVCELLEWRRPNGGDWTADSAGLGYLGSAGLFGALLALTYAAYRWTKISRTGLFWSAFILT